MRRNDESGRANSRRMLAALALVGLGAGAVLAGPAVGATAQVPDAALATPVIQAAVADWLTTNRAPHFQ